MRNYKESELATPYNLYRGCRKDCYFELVNPKTWEAILVHADNCPNKDRAEKSFKEKD